MQNLQVMATGWQRYPAPVSGIATPKPADLAVTGNPRFGILRLRTLQFCDSDFGRG
jgi:hypothetical protein